MKNLSQEILNYLFENKDFLKSLSQEFNKKEINEIRKYAQDIDREYPEIMDQFHDWLECEFDKSDTNVLTIGWDSSGWGPGGNGCVRFKLCFGIVNMTSSDYSEDHIEIFNKDIFYPWGIEKLENEYIDMDSDIYNEIELLTLANKMGMMEDTILTIKDKEINR